MFTWRVQISALLHHYAIDNPIGHYSKHEIKHIFKRYFFILFVWYETRYTPMEKFSHEGRLYFERYLWRDVENELNIVRLNRFISRYAPVIYLSVNHSWDRRGEDDSWIRTHHTICFIPGCLLFVYLSVSFSRLTTPPVCSTLCFICSFGQLDLWVITLCSLFSNSQLVLRCLTLYYIFSRLTARLMG